MNVYRYTAGCSFYRTSFLVCYNTSRTSRALTGQGQKSRHRLVCLMLALFC